MIIYMQISPGTLYSPYKNTYLVHNTETQCKMFKIYTETSVNVLYKIDDIYYVFYVKEVRKELGTVSVYPNSLEELPDPSLLKSRFTDVTRNRVRKIPAQIAHYLNLLGCEVLPPAPVDIGHLNAVLNARCNNVRLEVGYRLIMPNVITEKYNSELELSVCLYVNEVGVSTIELSLDDDIMNLEYSSTHEKYEGNKYNKLTRAAAVVIAHQLGCTRLTSMAINTASAYILIKYFHGRFDDLAKGRDPNSFTSDNPQLMQNIISYYKDKENPIVDYNVTCKINKSIKEEVESRFNDFVHEINCDPMVAGKRTRKQSRS